MNSMNSAWLGAFAGGGDCQWEDGTGIPREGRTRPDIVRRDHRRRRVRDPYELSPEAQSSQRRMRRENQRQRSLHMACTLMSVTSLTPSCGPELLLTKYQRLSQLVRYTAFLEDATSALVRELGVRLNFDFSPVTRYIRRLRYQSRTGTGVFDFPADEADEVMKLLDTMSAGSGEQQQQQATSTASSWTHRNASSTAAGQPVQPPQSHNGGTSPHACILPH